MSKTKKVTAIEKVYGAVDVVAVQPTINGCLTQLATILSQENLPPDALAAVMSIARQAKDVIEDGIEKVAKIRLIEVIKRHGKATTDKGSMGFNVGGWHLGMQPYRTGVDPKKLEGMLRAKGIDPAKWMVQTISYSLNADKVTQLQDKKILTVEELDNCKYNESWTVKTPTREE